MRGGTEIGKVRGHGAAGEGTQHWWMQRVTALSNLLLVVWFIASLLMLPNHDHSTVTNWLKQPLVAIPMLLLSVSVFHHLRLGLQVLIEDYVREAGNRIAALLVLTAFSVTGGTVAVFSILKIALGS